jgi:hypothetical protein
MSKLFVSSAYTTINPVVGARIQNRKADFSLRRPARSENERGRKIGLLRSK